MNPGAGGEGRGSAGCSSNVLNMLGGLAVKRGEKKSMSFVK